MPNGGVPLHMVLYPNDKSAYVIYLRGSEVQIFSRDEWTLKKSGGVPLLSLNSAEAGSVAWFVSHWCDSSLVKPAYGSPNINAEFDF